MLPPVARTVVDELRTELVARFADRLADLRVFGSYARGDPRPGSDVDVLVVIDRMSDTERRQVFELAWEVYTRHLVHVSPLALSTAEWTSMKEREYRIVREIERESVRP